MLKQRVGAVGLLWDKSGAALLGIPDFKGAARKGTFDKLLEKGAVAALSVEGLKERFFVLAEDLPLLEACLADAFAPRTELLAPLDPLIWDRAMIKALFDFDYTWEVYVTPAKRKHGYYVLPLLQGERFIGRAEPVFDRKADTLQLKSLWYESDVKASAAVRKATDRCIARFEGFLRANARPGS